MCRCSALDTREKTDTKPDPCPNGAYVLVGNTLTLGQEHPIKSERLSAASESVASRQPSLEIALDWRELPHPRSWTLPSVAFTEEYGGKKAQMLRLNAISAWELPVGLAEEFIQTESHGPACPFAQSCFFHFPTRCQSPFPEEPNMKWYYIISSLYYVVLYCIE